MATGNFESNMLAHFCRLKSICIRSRRYVALDSVGAEATLILVLLAGSVRPHDAPAPKTKSNALTMEFATLLADLMSTLLGNDLMD